jgi:predicted N-acyltransferase
MAGLVDTFPLPTSADIGHLTGHVVEAHSSINSIDTQDWGRCNRSHDVFVSHAYLRVLEDSGTVSAESGFAPRHIMVRDADERPIAAVPAYLNTHSIGELGADFGFGMSHNRSCVPYYPKLQV